MVEGGFCSALCQAAKEHEDKLRQNEHMSIYISDLDDGGYTVEIKMRNDTGFPEMNFSELTKNYDGYEDALRGVANLCLAVADKMKDPE
jgi:hypothetical protein